jgi:signal transduction histidine kinase
MRDERRPIVDPEAEVTRLRARVSELERLCADGAAREEGFWRFFQQLTEGVAWYRADQRMSIDLPEEEQAAFILDRTMIADCNDAYARMYGFESADAMIGASLAGVMSGSRQDKLEIALGFIRNGYRATDVEVSEQDASGRHLWTSNTMLGIIEDRHLVCAWGLQRDITAHKQALLSLQQREQEVQHRAEKLASQMALQTKYAENVLRSIADGVFTVDVDHRITSWNLGAEAMTDWKAADVIGQRCMRVLQGRGSPDDSRPLCGTPTCPVNRACTNRRSVSPGNRDRCHFLGGHGLMALSAAPLFDEQGHPSGAVCVFRDVSSEREMLAGIQRAHQAKNLFLANVSHEIRTPLNAILGFSQLLLNDPAVDVRHRLHLDSITRSGEHLLALMNDILQMSKIEAGRVSPALAPFDLRDLVSDLAAIFRLRTNAKGLAFHVEMPEDLPCAVVGDGNKLRQILTNLLGNAIKFTERGQVMWRLRCTPGPGREARLVSEVQDTGPGIAPADVRRIFKAFEQTVYGARAAGGTGLGLAISREFARMMGGDVTVETEVGRGSCFRLEVRIQQGAPAEVPHPERRRRSEPSACNGAQPDPDASLGAALGAVPNSLTRDLRAATTAGDYDRMLGLIERIAMCNAQAGQRLRILADAFQYQQLLDLLPRELSHEG